MQVCVGRINTQAVSGHRLRACPRKKKSCELRRETLFCLKMSLRAGAGVTSHELRYACDGFLYSMEEFSAFYTPDEADFMWQCALPENLDLATKKMRTVVEAYENLAWRLARQERETVLPPAVPTSAFVDRPLKFRRHYDFVEVGTSDWGTLTQFCAGQQDSTYVSWIADLIRTSIDGLRWARGQNNSISRSPSILVISSCFTTPALVHVEKSASHPTSAKEWRRSPKSLAGPKGKMGTLPRQVLMTPLKLAIKQVFGHISEN